MLLLAILLLPVIWGADQEFNFGEYIIRINEKNTLTSIETRNSSIDELNLSNLGIKSIDTNTFDRHLTDIVRLNMANNWLTTLPKSVFSKLYKLQYLSLADNNISSFDQVFIGLENLRTLDLSNNLLKHIGESYFYGLSKDVQILTGGNDISNISTLLFSKPKISQGATIPTDDSVAKKLNNLLPTNNFTSVEVCRDTDLWKLIEVAEAQAAEKTRFGCIEIKVNHTDLKLSLRYDIHSFEKGWYRVHGLPVRALDLAQIGIDGINSNILNDLPEEIVEVDLSYNFIRWLEPGRIENWYLRTLILDHNFLTGILDYALIETNLSVLSLKGNSLRNTTFIKTLPSTLVKLDLSYNALRTIESGSFRNCEALKELNLSNNRIYHLYKGIFEGLKSIEYLNIGRNNLESVTNNTLFAMPDTLLTVILDDNRIHYLERGSFVRVPKDKLSLQGNKISTIENGSFHLPTLQELNLSHNKLTSFSSDIFIGRNDLMTLDLSFNPLKKRLSGGLDTIFDTQEGTVLLSGVPIDVIEWKRREFFDLSRPIVIDDVDPWAVADPIMRSNNWNNRY